MRITIHKRTFEAATKPKGPERDALNADALTSEYFPSQPWLTRKPALMSDGSQNPVQGFHNKTHRTKADAELYARLNS